MALMKAELFIGIDWPTDGIDELIFSEKDEKWQTLAESQIKY